MTTYTELPVKFYIEDNTVLAVFPTEKATHHDDSITCYAQVGQHSSCSPDYLKGLKRANPEQYYPLLKELRSIYENPNLDNQVIILKIK